MAQSRRRGLKLPLLVICLRACIAWQSTFDAHGSLGIPRDSTTGRRGTAFLAVPRSAGSCRRALCSTILLETLKPQAARSLGGPLDGVAGVLGVGGDASSLAQFSGEFDGSGKRMRVRFSTCWPVATDAAYLTGGRLSVGYKAGKDNRYAGETGFVKAVKGVGSNIEDIQPKRLVQLLFGDLDDVTFAKQSGKSKVISAEGKSSQVVGVSFNRVKSDGNEVSARAVFSATVVSGDLYAFVMTCRPETWKVESDKARINAAVESFQVMPI